VPRPRLIERLNDALHCKLALVSAPAGFGKTALLSEWLRTRDRWTIAENRLPSAAWLSLDAEDNKLARFLSYLIATLAPIAPEVGQAAGNGVGAQVKGAGGAGVSQVDGGQHEGGAVHQCPGDGNPLLLAAREAVRKGLPPIQQSHRHQQWFSPLLDHAVVRAVQFQRKHHVLPNR
jgi:hypothetical protein